MTKLSPAQLRVLKALAEPHPSAVAHFIHGPDTYWFLSNRDERIRFTTMVKLKIAGFIEVKKDSIGYPDYATITPAGRAFLASLEKK